MRGDNPIGFLPHYFGESFNVGLVGVVREVAKVYGRSPALLANLLTFGGLTVLGIIFVMKPATNGRSALLRCIWLIGWFTLFTQNLFSWYLLWLLPLLVCFLESGGMLGFKLSSITAWFFFTGLAMLSYTFFIKWHPIPWVQIIEFFSLYALLLAAWLRNVPSIAATNTHRLLKIQER
jgi:hypothetical protein